MPLNGSRDAVINLNYMCFLSFILLEVGRVPKRSSPFLLDTYVLCDEKLARVLFFLNFSCDPIPAYSTGFFCLQVTEIPTHRSLIKHEVYYCI